MSLSPLCCCTVRPVAYLEETAGSHVVPGCCSPRPRVVGHTRWHRHTSHLPLQNPASLKQIQNTLNRNMQEHLSNLTTALQWYVLTQGSLTNAILQICSVCLGGGFSFRVIPLMLFVILPHTSNHTFWPTQLFQLHRHNLKHLYLDLNDTSQTSQPSETTAYDGQ